LHKFPSKGGVRVDFMGQLKQEKMLTTLVYPYRSFTAYVIYYSTYRISNCERLLICDSNL